MASPTLLMLELESLTRLSALVPSLTTAGHARLREQASPTKKFSFPIRFMNARTFDVPGGSCTRLDPHDFLQA